ncbi:hypothetical protein DDF62_02595 [Caulobacter radicis]|uniref:LOG family protein n=1 Tax=Caulobacter radicis TaxID=2172650 RepID=UPI000D56A2D4|nr:hypothetical protein [Caulobacter radicis]PVM92062.1 hypothetical protein DDF62_02595 [Caulobacter radicis]
MSYEPRDALYARDDLLAGLDRANPIGFFETFDLRAFRTFVKDGGATAATRDVREAQARHDASIADALRVWLEAERPRLVGVMGGHKLTRAEPAYARVAELARTLTREGFLVVTGGGPGAMEAAHLGALLASGDDALLGQALALLAPSAALPNLIDLVGEDGQVRPGREGDLKAAHLWLDAALKVLDIAPADPGRSLAIPTWLYGQEPTMPFATAYAKYFQNSIREEALVTEARAGIIYARGGGGTIREIFQDVEQNYYAPSAALFTPMIFYDGDGYWQRPAIYGADGKVQSPGIRLDVVLPDIVRFARASRKDAGSCLAKLAFTTDTPGILDLLNEHAPVAEKAMKALLSNPVESLARARWNRG